MILTGVKACTLYDKAPASFADLASHFYLSEADIGAPRAEATLPHLRTLNPYTSVDVHDGAVDAAFISQFTVVVVTESSYERQMEINDACREHNVKFITTDAVGVFGRAFCDFGPDFIVVDPDGELPRECVLSNVVVDQAGIATITVDEEKRHGLRTGDHVTFREIQGTVGLNDGAPKRIVKVVDGYSFQVDDCTGAGFDAYVPVWCACVLPHHTPVSYECCFELSVIQF